MKTFHLIVTLEKSHRLYRIELNEAQKVPYPEYCRFLMYVGFPSLAHEVLTACSMYPTSIDACRDALADLAHSFYQAVGKFRLSHIDQERLTRLIDHMGNEVIDILDNAGFYIHNTITSMMTHGELTASPSIRSINPRTFVVILHEDEDHDVHTLLSQHQFGSYDPSQWSH